MLRGAGSERARTIKLVITDDFMDALFDLPRRVQTKARRLMGMVRENPYHPGLNYEKLHANDNLYSLRVDGTYRVIMAREDVTNTFVLLWVDHHDEAYAWASRRQCSINPNTGVLQVYGVQNIDVPVEMQPRFDVGEISTNVVAEPLFSGTTDAELAMLGVPDTLLSLVRSITTEEGFYKTKGTLPVDAYEHLEWLVNGCTMADVLMEYGPRMMSDGVAPTAIPATMAEALETGAVNKSFHVIESDEELRRIFDAPLEKWRVFLHPTQRKLVERTFNGPARVLGGAGTGKTVVAMHRARRLAAQLDEPGDCVLFTTFNSNLAKDIETNLKSLCSESEMAHIQVINLDKWAMRFLQDHGRPFTIEYGEGALVGMWSEAFRRAGVDDAFDAQFVKTEWERVILPNEAFTYEKYVHTRRPGMGKRLLRDERKNLWAVVEQYRALVEERGARDIDYAYCGVRDLVLSLTGFVPYRHVVVDEAQDFSPSAFRLLRALAGSQRPDDLFVVGDAHQRIYGRRVTLSSCGVDIRGRGSKLRINYRTTEETRRSAEALLAGADYDDLDGGADPLDGTQSLTHGEAPAFGMFEDENEEASWIFGRIDELVSAGVAQKDICVVFRLTSLVERFMEQCAATGHTSVRLASDQPDDRSMDGLRLATMHRVKGLEFEYVFVAGLNEGVLPPSRVLEQARARGTEKDLCQSERSLLYVAMTRAKRRVFLSCGGRPSNLVMWNEGQGSVPPAPGREGLRR